MRRVRTAVVNWATAESSVAGYGADHDRIDQVAKSKLVVKPLATLVQGLGQ